MGRTIAVDDETHARLKTHGRFGDSYCDIIKRLLNKADEERNCTEQGDETDGQE